MTVPDEIFHRHAFEAAAEAQRDAIFRPENITEPNPREILVGHRVIRVTKLSEGEERFVAGRLLHAIAVTRIDQIDTLRIGEKLAVDLLKRGQFRDNSPATVAGLNRRIDRPTYKSGVAVEIIHHVVRTGWEFDTESEADVSIVEFRGIEQPGVADQSQITDAARSSGEAMNEIVLVITRAVPRLNGQLQCNAESASDLVNDAEIKSVNMRVGVKRGIGRIRQFRVAVKFTKRMKPAIGSRGRELVRLEIWRSFFNRATGIDGTQTGREQARGHSPLREELWRCYSQNRNAHQKPARSSEKKASKQEITSIL